MDYCLTIFNFIISKLKSTLVYLKKLLLEVGGLNVNLLKANKDCKLHFFVYDETTTIGGGIQLKYDQLYIFLKNLMLP